MGSGTCVYCDVLKEQLKNKITEADTFIKEIEVSRPRRRDGMDKISVLHGRASAYEEVLQMIEEGEGMQGEKTHELKTLPKYFHAIKTGMENFGIRKNDRNFKVGDSLFLHEYDPLNKKYTGDSILALVTYVTDFAQKENYVVMGIKIANETIVTETRKKVEEY